MLPCLNKKLFGIDCLGCGIQRALSLVFQGEFIAAFKMYPAIYTLLLLAIIVGINFFYKIKYAQKIISILAILNIAIIVISYVIKMNQLI
ncbi:DUF2752 domain-containing protein [Tenacibaculum sp.]